MNFSILSVVALALFTVVSTKSAACAGVFNSIVTSGKLFILSFIVIVSLLNFDSKNFTPFFDEKKGVAGLIEGSTILFFGYLGFDFMTTIAEEAKNPVRDVPRAIILSNFICMMIYACVAFSVQGVGKLSEKSGDGETALAEIFTERKMAWMSILIYIAALLGITAASFTN